MVTTQREQRGQFSTAPAIADLMISMISAQFAAGKILEPSFGTGVFVDLLLEKRYTRIFGYELDNALFQNLLTAYDTNKVVLRQGDFLASPRAEKFDVIIGNPPYVYYNNIEPQILTPLLKNPFWQPLINGEWDLLYFFIVWAVEKLKPSGELIFITPYYWFNSTYAISLRKYLCEQGSFESIIHFGEMNLFRDCAPNTIIFKFIREHSNDPIKIIEYKQRQGAIDTITNEIRRQLDEFPERSVETDIYRIFTMPQFDTSLSWALINPSEREVCHEIERSTLTTIPQIPIDKNTLTPITVPLTSLLDEKDLRTYNLPKRGLTAVLNGRKKWYLVSPYQTHYLKLKQVLTVSVGMVTGFDKAFRISEEEQQLLNEEEQRHIIQCVKGLNCERFTIKKPELYIYVDDVKSTEKLARDFPYVFQKFSQYRAKLKQRYNIHNKQWFHWATIRNKEIYEQNFNQPKIFVPCLDRHPQSRFSLTDENVYGSGDTLAIVPSPHSPYHLREDLKYVLAWLNCSFLQKWYRIKGSKRGHRIQYTQSYVEEMPIRLINWKSEKELAIYNSILEMVSQILERRGNRTDFETEIDQHFRTLLNERVSTGD